MKTVSKLTVAMLGGWLILLLAFTLVGYAAARDAANDRAAGIAEGAKKQLLKDFGKLPLSFEINQGQTDGQVLFLSRAPGFNLFLTPTEMLLELRRPPAASPLTKADLPEQPHATSVRMQLVMGDVAVLVALW